MNQPAVHGIVTVRLPSRLLLGLGGSVLRIGLATCLGVGGVGVGVVKTFS